MPEQADPSENRTVRAMPRRRQDGLSPSKAARRVGNTGPQPRPARVIPLADRRAERGLGEPLDVRTEESRDEAAPSSRPWDLAGLPPLPGTEGLAEWLAQVREFLGRRLRGEYAVDDFGFDPELNDRVLMNLVRPLYRSWFRVEASGLENVPAQGGALVVANHSGTIPLDAVMTQVALLDDHPSHRHLRMLGANLVFNTPLVSQIARASGHTLACHPDAERLLTQGELVGVWPEGFKGIGKPFSERYKLQRFGRGGFVSAAVRSGTPIIPTAIVGAEEIYPMLADARLLARLLGIPYFPITPTFPALGPLGLIPLPSKWFIHFGEPISTEGLDEGAADDPMEVFNLTDQVREQIQQMLYRLLMKRPSVFG